MHTGESCDHLGAYVIKWLEDIVQAKYSNDNKIGKGSSLPGPLNRSNQTSQNLLSYAQDGESAVS